MPRFNADAIEDIVIRLNGTDYTVDISSRKMAEAAALSNGTDAATIDVLAKQFSILTGQAPGVFLDVDIRKLKSAMEYIMGEVAGKEKDAKKK